MQSIVTSEKNQTRDSLNFSHNRNKEELVNKHSTTTKLHDKGLYHNKKIYDSYKEKKIYDCYNDKNYTRLQEKPDERMSIYSSKDNATANTNNNTKYLSGTEINFFIDNPSETHMMENKKHKSELICDSKRFENEIIDFNVMSNSIVTTPKFDPNGALDLKRQTCHEITNNRNIFINHNQEHNEKKPKFVAKYRKKSSEDENQMHYKAPGYPIKLSSNKKNCTSLRDNILIAGKFDIP